MTRKSMGRLQRERGWEPRWVYIGFKLEDGQYAGGLVLQAVTLDEAVNRAAHFGIRGKVSGFIIDRGIVPDAKYRERILSTEECSAFEESIRLQAEALQRPSN